MGYTGASWKFITTVLRKTLHKIKRLYCFLVPVDNNYEVKT